MQQYPHTMSFESGAGNATRDDNGNWQQGTAGSIVNQECRAEPNGSGRQVQLADGSSFTYAHTVYMPLSSVDVPVGVSLTVIVTEDGSPKAKGIVKQFSRGQLNCRAWL